LGTAQNDDFTATAGTLNFADGVASQTISIPINGDPYFEGDDTFIITLSNPTGDSALDLQTVRTVTILNDDTAPIIEFAAPAVVVAENAGLLTVVVKRTGFVYNQGSSVRYTTQSGSAQAGSDFTAATGFLNCTLAFNENRARFPYSIRAPTSPRPGRPARTSSCCRPFLVFRQTRRPTVCMSIPSSLTGFPT